MIVYTDQMDSKQDINIGQVTTKSQLEEQRAKSVLYHDQIHPGKTYYKIIKGTSVASTMMFCSFSTCL